MCGLREGENSNIALLSKLEPLDAHHYYWISAWKNTPLQLFSIREGEKSITGKQALNNCRGIWILSTRAALRISCLLLELQRSLSMGERVPSFWRRTFFTFWELDWKVSMHWNALRLYKCFFSAEKLYFTRMSHLTPRLVFLLFASLFCK